MTSNESICALWANSHLCIWSNTSEKPKNVINLSSFFKSFKPYSGDHEVKLQWTPDDQLVILTVHYTVSLKDKESKLLPLLEDDIIIHHLEKGANF